MTPPCAELCLGIAARSEGEAVADYTLQLSDDEVARYRLMAEQARDQEAALWAQAGVAPGARIADVGCGPCL